MAVKKRDLALAAVVGVGLYAVYKSGKNLFNDIKESSSGNSIKETIIKETTNSFIDKQRENLMQSYNESNIVQGITQLSDREALPIATGGAMEGVPLGLNVPTLGINVPRVVFNQAKNIWEYFKGDSPVKTETKEMKTPIKQAPFYQNPLIKSRGSRSKNNSKKNNTVKKKIVPFHKNKETVKSLKSYADSKGVGSVFKKILG